MKKILFIIVLLVVSSVCGCNRDRRLVPFGWSSAGPEFDSLTVRAERLYNGRDSIDELQRIIARMRQLADSNPAKPVLNSRALYWQGRLTYSLEDQEKGYAMMQQALLLTDSAKHPYDYKRIEWNLDMDYHEPTVEEYNRLLKDYRFFMDHKDYLTAGGLAMQLGTFLDDLGATAEGMPYLDQADSLFMLANIPQEVWNNRINHANALRAMRDTVGALRLWRAMLADTVHPLSPWARDIALGNIYTLDERDTTALRQAWNLVKDDDGMAPGRFAYATYLADEALKRDRLDEARYYASRAVADLDAYDTPEALREYYDMRYQLFEKEGMRDSAYRYLKLAACLNDSILSSANRVEVSNAALAGRIRQIRQEAELEERNSVIIILSASFAVILLLVGACIVIWRHWQRQRYASIKSQLELERANRRLLAKEVIIQGKDQLVAEMDQKMSRMSESGEISRETAGKIKSSISMHKGLQPQHDRFAEAFGEVNPDFDARMLADYPTLTTSDLRLASYIVMKMENKHIASVMGIRPESVKQARWRLRGKMGLSKGDSLEEVLRRYASR